MADVTVTAADVRPLPGANILRIKAGAGVNVGYAAYVAADAKVEHADADAAASAQAIGVIVSCPNGSLTGVDEDMVDVAGPGSLVTGFSGLTPGGLMYASVNAGRIADTRPAVASGDYVWIIGKAISATTILIQCFTDDFAAQ